MKFAADVEAILNKHGQKDSLGSLTGVIPEEDRFYIRDNDKRPTRTQIIEEAVRAWHVLETRNTLSAVLSIGPLKANDQCEHKLEARTGENRQRCPWYWVRDRQRITEWRIRCYLAERHPDGHLAPGLENESAGEWISIERYELEARLMPASF